MVSEVSVSVASGPTHAESGWGAFDKAACLMVGRKQRDRGGGAGSVWNKMCPSKANLKQVLSQSGFSI